MTCIREEHLLLKTLSFIQSQSDQIMATAPTLIRTSNLESIPFRQFPKIFAMLFGGYKVESI
jgi:hypothetical protein